MINKIDSLKLTYKYRAKISATLGLIALICVAVSLILGYMTDFLKIGFILQIYPSFYMHVSNFALSVIFYCGIGYMWLLFGVKFKLVVMLGIFTAAANLICESPLMGFMNTPDYLDAIFGIAGTIIAFVFLTIIFKHGLIIKDCTNKS